MGARVRVEKGMEQSSTGVRVRVCECKLRARTVNSGLVRLHLGHDVASLDGIAVLLAPLCNHALCHGGCTGSSVCGGGGGRSCCRRKQKGERHAGRAPVGAAGQAPGLWTHG